jgi:hypothetical protein
MWLSDPIPSEPAQLVTTRPEVFEWNSHVEVPTGSPSGSNLHNDHLLASAACIEESDVSVPETASDASALWLHIQASKDRLFFISFRLPGTLRAKWFLVAVDLLQTASDTRRCGDPAVSGVYFVHFFGRHPCSDDIDSDCEARWWPLWHEFVISDDGVIDYGKRVLIPPSQTVNLHDVVPWGECVTLTDASVCLLGPFDFQDPSVNPPGRSVRSRQYVPLEVWTQLSEICSF